MLKDIIKNCKKHDIIYKDGKFLVGGKEIKQEEFLRVFSYIKFKYGLEEAINRTKMYFMYER